MSGLWLDGTILLAALIPAPILGGLVLGLDGMLTAKLKGKPAVSVFEPFRTFIALWKGDKIISPRTIPAFLSLLLVVSSTVWLLFGEDILVITVLFGLSLLLEAIAGAELNHYEANWPLKRVRMTGACVPMLFFLVTGFQLSMGSSLVSVIHPSSGEALPAVLHLPLVFVSFLFVWATFYNKRPFYFGGGICLYGKSEAEQNYTEGRVIKIVGTLTSWYQSFIMMGLTAMLFMGPWWLGALMVVVVFLLGCISDCILPDMPQQWIFRHGWVSAVGAGVVNLVWLYLRV